MVFKSLELLLVILSLSSPTAPTIYSTNTIDSSVTPIESAKFICDNLVKFEDYYNAAFPDTVPLSASSVDDFIPLYIENQGEQIEGILIDLNEENGCITIGYNYEIFDIQVKGNQPFYDYPGYDYYFSTSTGYSYYDTKINDWSSINKDNNSDQNDWKNIELNQRTYKGQDTDQTGNGKIVNTKDYVLDKYGSGYSLANSHSLDMDLYLQSDLSVYKTIEQDGQAYSEGNCWIVSAFHVLQYLAKTKYTDMYSDDIVTYDAKNEEPDIYSKHFDNNGNCKEKTTKYDGTIVDKWQLNEKVFLEFYTEVRRFVNSEFKKCDGGTEAETSYIVKRVPKNHGHTIDYANHYRWGAYTNYVKYKIDSNIPCIWSTKNDTYGAHSMAVCGYKYYKKTTKFWIFNFYTYKLFYELRDGHLDKPAYYDISGHIGISCLTFFKLY